MTVAVEGLMDGKPLPELESFLTLDPKVRPFLLTLSPHRVARVKLLCYHAAAALPVLGPTQHSKLRHMHCGTWR